MSEQLTPVKEQGQIPADPPAAPPPAPSGGPSGKKKKKKKRSAVKTVIALVLVAAILGGIGFGMYKLVFEEDGSLGEPMTDFVMRGSIQSMVQGSGLTKAKDSATMTPGTGTLLELYVSEGDHVEVGCNSVLNPGTVIGRNASIYPLSSVRGAVPPDSIFKGPGNIVPRD